ncbi:MAG: CPBP family intramembrane metalloprotease [Clostridiales bacterium]|nr:CPBP family intramembrane metalloprotease [Clostridiales bacterium]
MDNSIKKTGFDMETKRIVLFLGITFFITYLIEIGVIARFLKSDDDNMLAIGQILVASVMLIPSLGVLLTRLITKEGFKNAWIKPNLKGNLRYYLYAWFVFVVLTVLGSVIYFLLYPENFTLNMEYLAKVYRENGLELEADQIRTGIYIQIVIGILLAPIMNAFTCFGEEWGWRGYLLPKMHGKLSMLPMLLINGLIWGLWHAPLTALGHNYGLDYFGHPFTGILAMCVFCIIMGTILSYLSLKTKSCIPAVIGHGSLNGFASIGMYFTKDGGNPFLGPLPTGIIGGLPFIIIAIVLGYQLIKDERRGN